MRILSLFSGIGAFEKALERERIPFHIVNYCEKDKYASKAYSLIHNIDEGLNLGDITLLNRNALHNVDMIVHGSPCQDFSVQGKQSGGDRGTGTLSSLLWYSVDIITDLRPRCVVWENVPNILSNRHRHTFDSYLQYLSELGYMNSYKVLNSLDFSVPQNRKRCFCVSILSGDVFEFPELSHIDTHLTDILEYSVPKKYYWPKERVDVCIKNTNLCGKSYSTVLEFEDPVSCAVRGRYYNGKTYQNLEFGNSRYANALTTVRKDSMVWDNGLRDFTPLECFRLMGFDDDDLYKLEGFSDWQIRKLAGNSIVVDVLQVIFKELFKNEDN